MGNETLYFKALERLNSYTSGSTDFERICHIIIKFMYNDYNFNTPEGGRGTQDGGYDGYDPIKKAKLACSIQKEYKEKIKSEVEKSKKNGDSKIFYLSNQLISEIEKNRVKTENDNKNIDLIIVGINELSREIDKYFQNQNDTELYDLLDLSSLRVGAYYNRSEVKPCNIEYNGNIYKKQVIINDKYVNTNFAKKEISENPLLDFLLLYFSEKERDSFKNITLCGIGYLGKTFLMKKTFNTLIDEFSCENNYSKYKFLPFIQFYDLKIYSPNLIISKVKNDIDPILIFLDGLDELNERKKIELDKEIQNIINHYANVHFIISGRNSSFIDIGIFTDSIHLYLEKYFDNDDIQLVKLMNEYKDTPISDLLTIPIYRNFILENKISKDSKLDDFYDVLVQENLKKDKKRRDYSSNISSRMAYNSETEISAIINEISDFCYELFINKRNVFTENEVKECFKNENHFFIFIYSSIIDYRDKNTVSFVSNFYYEYFVSNALINKDINSIIQNFFIRGKVRIQYIDILMLFMNLIKTKQKNLYGKIRKKLIEDNIACILLCEFDLIANNDRYKYFISIFKEYNKKKKKIYYYQFHQVYGPLKNIDNMAQRMQQLLPSCYKTKAVDFLKSEIIAFLKQPLKENALAFSNATILLSPFIDNLWDEKEQTILKEISLPLIRFFLYNDISKELKGLLSEKTIFDWYERFNWTTAWKQKEWELFYENISGNSCGLLSEIADDNEYDIKFNFLSYFDNNDIIKLLLFPILRYAIKNKHVTDMGTASIVPDKITDDYEIPMAKIDDRNYELKYLLKNLELNLSDILNLLIFAMENNKYHYIKNTHDSPIIIMEEKLYNNINLIESKDYKNFSKYYFNTDEFYFDDRLFKSDKTKQFENLKDFLVNDVIEKKTDKWETSNFLCKLIDFNDVERSLNCLDKIKKESPEKIYANTVFYIFNSEGHILKNHQLVINEYNNLFKKDILEKNEKDKKLENIKKEIELIRNNDIALMLDTKAMIDELCKINDFLSSSMMADTENECLDKLCLLKYESIKNTILYRTEKAVPPVFSECAIKIIEDFYRNNIFDIEEITTRIKVYLSDEKNFYIYFYQTFIHNSQELDNTDIKNKINNNPNLVQKILNSMNNDASDKFLNKPIEYFENSNNNMWLKAFFYYYEILLNNIPPKWMQTEHILKLIVVFDVHKEGCFVSDSISIDWFVEKFPKIDSHQIIEYGLKIIEYVKYCLSRIQIVKYFIDYYKSNEQNELTNEILKFIINTTKKLFDFTNNNDVYAEFQDISHFWLECNSNHIDSLFPKFTTGIIITTIKTSREDNNYRKNVLLYCGRVATFEQKTKIIREVENDYANNPLSDEENYEIQEFLAFLGSEKSIKFIINSYLCGKAINSRFDSNNYSLGFIKQNDDLLNEFINLLVYSKTKYTERRNILLSIAQNGIKLHLTKGNFKIFEKKILNEIKKHRKNSPWISEYYEEYLLQMEQYVYL